MTKNAQGISRISHAKLAYWGDMDAAGLEILSGCRQAGLACTSIFMDMGSFEEYERFGTSVDSKNH